MLERAGRALVARSDRLDHALPEDADDGGVGLDDVSLLVALRDLDSVVQMLVELFLLIGKHLESLEVLGDDLDIGLVPILGRLLQDSVRVFLELCEHLEVAMVEELLEARHDERFLREDLVALIVGRQRAQVVVR